jgi:hypothetical protein
MSGRGRGHGRNGRAPARGSGRDSSRKSRTFPKKTLSDYQYYLGSAKQASDYEKTTEFLINYIRKTFTFGNDIGTALEELQPYDMTPHHPTLMASNSTDVKTKEAEDKQY